MLHLMPAFLLDFFRMMLLSLFMLLRLFLMHAALCIRRFMFVFWFRLLVCIFVSMLTLTPALFSLALLFTSASLLLASSPSCVVYSLSVGGRTFVTGFGAQFLLLVFSVEVSRAEAIAIPVEAAKK
jgi:hypothetical protein